MNHGTAQHHARARARRVISVDIDGNENVQSFLNGHLQVTDLDTSIRMVQMLSDVLKELKKMNLHLSILTDNDIHDTEVNS